MECLYGFDYRCEECNGLSGSFDCYVRRMEAEEIESRRDEIFDFEEGVEDDDSDLDEEDFEDESGDFEGDGDAGGEDSWR